ncbi:hypothetical protein V6N11_064516 [Hibiscus sabdariffa]|uniref:Uncharacterized protein n=1 Tax=Hibiscus sabdariffa TaxID=183260 RepID=A0ABR2A3C5_9ROSI
MGVEIEADQAMEDQQMDSGTVDGVDLDGGANISYAAMAAKFISTDENSPEVFSFTDEEVEVVDKDCLVDEAGAFSMIKFSDTIHEKIDKSMRK